MSEEEREFLRTYAKLERLASRKYREGECTDEPRCYEYCKCSIYCAEWCHQTKEGR